MKAITIEVWKSCAFTLRHPLHWDIERIPAAGQHELPIRQPNPFALNTLPVKYLNGILYRHQFC
jgi:hypothetical protein